MLAGGFLPFLATLRFLASDREFVYLYEDIPPHVRRIAERERQRVELETARSIQSSILPQLPPRLQGVDLAHAYLPATEVGGDFYDVLALEDGRLALAVGDVAGHGVSSGLVMSMAKSALAVQVTFDPDVGAVFSTLNRLVYQTARKRMLATLCYALLDAPRRELRYASAGHLFPYRVSKEGRVEGLESISYPLGVRAELPVQERLARLEAGDYLVLYSDGIIEAHRDGSDDLFGFQRLEESLSRHAGGGVEALRDGVLGDLERFTHAAHARTTSRSSCCGCPPRELPRAAVSLVQLFAAPARRLSTKTAIEFAGLSGAPTELTYGDLDEAAARAARSSRRGECPAAIASRSSSATGRSSSPPISARCAWRRRRCRSTPPTGAASWPTSWATRGRG